MQCYCFACVVSQYQELSEGRGTYDFLYKPVRPLCEACLHAFVCVWWAGGGGYTVCCVRVCCLLGVCACAHVCACSVGGCLSACVCERVRVGACVCVCVCGSGWRGITITVHSKVSHFCERLNHSIVKNLITRLSVSATAPPLAKQPPAGRRRHLQHSLRGPVTALQRNQPPQALQPARLRQRLHRVRQPSLLHALLGNAAQLSRLRRRRPLSDFEAGDQ